MNKIIRLLIKGRYYDETVLRKDKMTSKKHQTARSRKQIKEAVFRVKQVIKKNDLALKKIKEEI